MPNSYICDLWMASIAIQHISNVWLATAFCLLNLTRILRSISSFPFPRAHHTKLISRLTSTACHSYVDLPPSISPPFTFLSPTAWKVSKSWPSTIICWNACPTRSVASPNCKRSFWTATYWLRCHSRSQTAVSCDCSRWPRIVSVNCPKRLGCWTIWRCSTWAATIWRVCQPLWWTYRSVRSGWAIIRGKRNAIYELNLRLNLLVRTGWLKRH